jgi:lysophospholipase L1-like esterase
MVLPMEWYEAEVRAKEHALQRMCARSHRHQNPVVFYGSSSIRLWKSLASDFPEIPVVNAGFGGSTLVACAWFFDRLVVPVNPSRLVLYAGDNDLGDGADEAGFTKRLEALLLTIDHFFPNIPLTMLTIKPSPARIHLLARIQACNGIIYQRLGRRPNSTVVDIHHPMLGHDGQPRLDYYAKDRLHMSPAGYRCWVERVNDHYDAVFGDPVRLS